MKTGESKFINIVIQKITSLGNNATGDRNKKRKINNDCKREKREKQRNTDRCTNIKNKNRNTGYVKFNKNVKTLEYSNPLDFSTDEIWYSVHDINRMHEQTCDFVQSLRKKRTNNFESLELLLTIHSSSMSNKYLLNKQRGRNTSDGIDNSIRGIEYLIDENKLRIKKKRIGEGVWTVLNEQKKQQQQQQQQQQKKRMGRIHDILRKSKKHDLDFKCTLDFDTIAGCYIEKGCTVECRKEAYERGIIHFQDTKPEKRATNKTSKFRARNNITPLNQRITQRNRIPISWQII